MTNVTTCYDSLEDKNDNLTCTSVKKKMDCDLSLVYPLITVFLALFLLLLPSHLTFLGTRPVVLHCADYSSLVLLSDGLSKLTKGSCQTD